MRTGHTLLACLFAAMLFSAAPLGAAQVALIEDTDGLILPAEGMCQNMLFGQGLCVNFAAKAFYQQYGDDYDMLVFFTNKPLAFLFNVMMGFPVRKAAEGIGLDNGVGLWGPADFGSAGRLRQCVKMGTLSGLPDDPNGFVSLPPITGLELLAHEIGHQWMVWLMLDFGDGRGPLDVLRGYEGEDPNGHFSAKFNSGSVMYGGMIVDNGDGTFTHTEGVRRYAMLDQYLMGLRTAAEMEPMFYVVPPGDDGLHGDPSMPWVRGSSGTFSGTRVDFTVDDIIRANGPRVPALSPCHIKFGFGIVHPVGFPPTEADIAKVERYRLGLEAWWPGNTDRRGSIDTTLDGCGVGTAECPGDPSVQCGAPVCDVGEIRCAGKTTVEECRDGQWAQREICPVGAVCEQGRCVSQDGDLETVDGDLPPADGDSPPTDGDTVADGDIEADGDLEPIMDGDQPAACNDGEKRCNGTGTAVIRCVSGGWEPFESCADQGLVCTLDRCLPAGEGPRNGGCGSGSAAPLLLIGFFGLIVLRLRGSVRPLQRNGEGSGERSAAHECTLIACQTDPPPSPPVMRGEISPSPSPLRRRDRQTGLLLALLVLLSGPTVRADIDVGEIALIEDATGAMMPVDPPFCPNIFVGQGMCLNLIAQAFYRTHPDEFDIMVIWTNKPLGAILETKMGLPVYKTARGIGLDGSISPDHRPAFGSRRLFQCVKMGSVWDMPDDPDGRYSLPPITGVELLAHEIGHQWLAWIMLDRNDGQGPLDVLRGHDGSSPNGHWSSWFDTTGSVMYGGIITDNGDGTFTSRGDARRYTQLDQYLMGLRTAAEVEPMFYVDVDGSGHGNPAGPMARGGTHELTGTRVDFTIDDVVRANGPREPALSPCHLKVAFVLVYPAGFYPPPEVIAEVDRYRLAIEAWWPDNTDRRGSLDTTLDGCGVGTAECPGNTSLQCGAPVCDDGEVRCAGKTAVEECRNGQWAAGPICPVGAVCEQGRCIAQDGDLDLPDGDAPDSDGPPVDGDMPVTDGDTAPADGDPDPGVDGDTPFVCQPNERRCNQTGTTVIRCLPDGSGWEPVESCAEQGLACTLDRCLQAEDPSRSGGCRTSGTVWSVLSGLLLAALRRRAAG